jgi:hypothetical protein
MMLQTADFFETSVRFYQRTWHHIPYRGIESRWHEIFRTVQTDSEAHPPVQWLPDLSGGYSGRSMVLIIYLLVAPSCEGVDTPPPTLYTCIGMSWIDLYLTNSVA